MYDGEYNSRRIEKMIGELARIETAEIESGQNMQRKFVSDIPFPADVQQFDNPDGMSPWRPAESSEECFGLAPPIADNNLVRMQIPFVAIILIVFAAYFFSILGAFWICARIQPKKFIQTKRVHRLEVDEPQTSSTAAVAAPSYMDCSGILKCCPCADFSFRKFLKSCCCDAEKFRRSVNCECIRPAVHGSQRIQGLNLVCCHVGGGTTN